MPFKKVCLICKKQFLGRRATKYCSNACNGIAYRVREYIQCKNCHKTFEVRPFEKRDFCSPQCRHQFRFHKCICCYCGKEFQAEKNRPGHYCSIICQNRALAQKKKNQIDYICRYCNKRFKKAKSSKRKFCSHKCYKSDLDENPKSEKAIEERFNISTKQFLEIHYLEKKLSLYRISCIAELSKSKIHVLLNKFRIPKRSMSESKALELLSKRTHSQHRGYRKDLSNQYFDSAWEANYYRYLQFKRRKFQYEPKAFKVMLPNNKITHYIPDFLIQDTFIEVKGYWRPDAKLKFKFFKEQYPHIKIAVLGPSQYKKIKNLYAKKIPNWEN